MKIKILTESLSINDIFTDEELSKFDKYQLIQIIIGFTTGLTKEQIGLYANPKFNGKQMLEIRRGFNSELPKEQILLYASPEFDSYQMYELRYGLNHGLTEEQVKLYANPEFNDDQMEEIKLMLFDYKYHHSSITLEDIEDILDPNIPYQKMNRYRMSFYEK